MHDPTRIWQDYFGGYHDMTALYGMDADQDMRAMQYELAVQIKGENPFFLSEMPQFPRSPHWNYIMKLYRFKQYPQQLARYAVVMSWLAPEVTYWTDLLVEARALGARDESGSGALALLNQLSTISPVTLTEKGDTYERWKNVTPSTVEYVVLSTMRGKDDVKFQQALAVFASYSRAVHNQLGEYDIHLRGFWRKIANSVPPERLGKWRLEMEPYVTDPFFLLNPTQ
jgi:hypothetical protein